MDAFQFPVAPLTVIESVRNSEPGARALSVKVHSSGPFAFRWGTLELPFDSGDSEFQISPKEVRLARLQGNVGAGSCTADASATFHGDSPSIELTFHFNQIDLAKLERAVHWLQPYSGQITGTVAIHQPNRKDAMVTGSIHLAQARFEDAPLFHPIANRLLAIGLQEPSTFDLQFAAAGESVKFETLKLWSTGHSLNLTGSIGLLGGLVDLSGATDGDSLLARVTGTIESPEWQIIGPKK
jgi:hypothetical protein